MRLETEMGEGGGGFKGEEHCLRGISANLNCTSSTKSKLNELVEEKKRQPLNETASADKNKQYSL